MRRPEATEGTRLSTGRERSRDARDDDPPATAMELAATLAREAAEDAEEDVAWRWLDVE